MADNIERARAIIDEFCPGHERTPAWSNGIMTAIASALGEVRSEERERCAKVAETDDSFMMLQDFGLQSAVTQKGINIAFAIRSGGLGRQANSASETAASSSPSAPLQSDAVTRETAVRIQNRAWRTLRQAIIDECISAIRDEYKPPIGDNDPIVGVIDLLEQLKNG